MAQRTVTQLIDDIDGTQIADGNGETVTFGLDGVTYEIDLTDANAKKLRDSLKFYADSARRVSGRSGGRSTSSSSRKGAAAPAKRDPDQTAAIKSWAKENGLNV